MITAMKHCVLNTNPIYNTDSKRFLYCVHKMIWERLPDENFGKMMVLYFTETTKRDKIRGLKETKFGKQCMFDGVMIVI